MLRLARTLICLLGCLAWSLAASAQEPTPSATATATEPALPELPLAEIPPLPSTELDLPSSEAKRSLETRLAELTALSIDGPLDEPDMAFLLADMEPAMVAAIAQRIDQLRESLDGTKAEAVLEAGRNAGKKAIRQRKKEAGEAPDGDWLIFVLSLESQNEAWLQAVELYGMLRMLEHIGSTPATRQMVATYSYFGDLVRIDLQRAIGRLGDKAVPALLEAKQHDARKVRVWAAKQLEMLGKAIPGEAVSTTDPVILADVLRAFGRIRDVEATRVILSFTNHDRRELREASRQAIGAIGEAAEWHLKDTYESLTGDKPPRAWDWKRVAQEIFRRHDQARLAKVFRLLGEGRAAQRAGRHADAVKAFDQVLARAPLFEERHAMAPAYVAHAEELLAKGDREQAAMLLRKARRLTPKDADTSRIEAQLTVLEAEQLIEEGIPDRFLLQRALELDPDNARAKELMASLATEAEARQDESKQWTAMIGVGAFALIAMALLVGWRRKPKPSQPQPEPQAPIEPQQQEPQQETQQETQQQETQVEDRGPE